VGRLNNRGDALWRFRFDCALKNGLIEGDDGNRRRKGKTFQRTEVAAIRIVADKHRARMKTAAQSFGEEVLAFNADYFGYLAATPGEGGAQLTDLAFWRLCTMLMRRERSEAVCMEGF